MNRKTCVRHQQQISNYIFVLPEIILKQHIFFLFKKQKQVKDWEGYEGEKSTLLTYLKKAEVELEKPIDSVNQENAIKDLQAKKVFNFLLLLYYRNSLLL